MRNTILFLIVSAAVGAVLYYVFIKRERNQQAQDTAPPAPGPDQGGEVITGAIVTEGGDPPTREQLADLARSGGAQFSKMKSRVKIGPTNAEPENRNFSVEGTNTLNRVKIGR